MPSEALNRGLRSARGAKRSHAAKKAGLSADQRAEIDAALGAYGARLTDDDRIAKGDKVMSVQVEAKGGRLKMVGGGNVLATYPASRAGQGVSDFVEKFWFWRKDGTASAQATKKKPPAQLQREIDEVLAGTSGRSKRSKRQRLNHATVADEWDVVMDAVLEGDVKRAAEIVENIRREHGVTAAETLMVANVPKAVPRKVWNKFLEAIGKTTAVDLEKALADRLGFIPTEDFILRAQGEWEGFTLDSLRSEERKMTREFEKRGGRGPDLADRIDEARTALALVDSGFMIKGANGILKVADRHRPRLKSDFDYLR